MALDITDCWLHDHSALSLQEQAGVRELLTTAAMLTGDECWLLGSKMRIRIEWVDEPPGTEEQLREMGEHYKQSALNILHPWRKVDQF